MLDFIVSGSSPRSVAACSRAAWMIIRLAIVYLLTALSSMAFGQTVPLSQRWQGKIGSLRLVLVIDSMNQSRPIAAHLESPDQTDAHIPVSHLHITADSLIAVAERIKGRFSGQFSEDKRRLSGVWQQGKMAPIPLQLQATDQSVVKSQRPQTPRPPFPYHTESVQYTNAVGTIRFGATLTWPNIDLSTTPKRLPAVILITGSGPQDRDETVFRHKPFAVIADHLTRNGFAVLRVDDRGVGQSSGSFAQATSADFAQDVLASIAFLKTRTQVDPKRIGLIGHSDGGLIAPLVASQSADVAYIVSLAGVAVKGNELLKKQLATAHQLAGMGSSEQQVLADLLNQLIDRAATPNMPVDSVGLQAIYRRWKQQQSAQVIQETGFTDESARSFIAELRSPWMHYFLAYDPAITLRKVRIPLLALNGGKDYQVDARSNLAGFAYNLKKAGNTHFQTVLLPGLNHLFQTAHTGSSSEYAQLEETFSPQALAIMTTWLKGVVQ